MSGIIEGVTLTLAGDDETPQPSVIVPHPLVQAGTNGDGFPVEQGFKGWTLQYTELDQDEYDILIGYYDEQQTTLTPTAVSVYDPEMGTTVAGTCIMGRPMIGNQNLLLNRVTVELTRFIPS